MSGASFAKPRLLIVCAGGHGRFVAEAVLISSDFELVGFLDDGAFASESDIWGFSVSGPAAAFVDCAVVVLHAAVFIANNALANSCMAAAGSQGLHWQV